MRAIGQTLILAARTQTNPHRNIHVRRPFLRIGGTIGTVNPNGHRIAAVNHQPQLLHKQPGHGLCEVPRNEFLELLALRLHERGAGRRLVQGIRVKTLVETCNARPAFLFAREILQHGHAALNVERLTQWDWLATRTRTANDAARPYGQQVVNRILCLTLFGQPHAGIVCQVNAVKRLAQDHRANALDVHHLVGETVAHHAVGARKRRKDNKWVALDLLRTEDRVINPEHLHKFGNPVAVHVNIGVFFK